MDTKQVCRKRTVCGVFLILVFAGLVVTATNVRADEFAGGSGTDYDPYQISNVIQLQNMNLNLNADYIIINDINANETSFWNYDSIYGGYYGFEPVGNDSTRFTGTLDGDDHTITSLYIDRIIPVNSSITNISLFGVIGPGGGVSNLSLTNSDITGVWNVGGIVGWNDGGTVSNSNLDGAVTAIVGSVGGLVGYNDHGTVNDSYTTGIVSGASIVGGLVGYNFESTVSNSNADGDVSGTHSEVGGLSGNNWGNLATISNSYATGSVSGGTDGAAGLVGWNYRGTITNSYSTGAVTGNDFVGGLVGVNDQGSVTNSFWDTQTSGQSTSYGGTGKTTDEMKNVRTFTDTNWSAGLSTPWDFVGDPYDDTAPQDIWDISSEVNDGYPHLTHLPWWPPTNEPPVLDSIPEPQLAYVGIPYYYDVNATDPDNDILYYEMEYEQIPLPYINHDTGEIGFTPPPFAEGTWELKISVTDGEFTDYQIVTFIITDLTSEVIVDDTDPEFGILSGDFNSIDLPNAYNGNTHYDDPGDGSESCGWRVDTLVGVGMYNVSVYKFDHDYMHLMATNAPFEIHHRDGIDIVSVDQSTGGTGWVHLGAYNFDNSFPQGIRLTDDADGYIAADAVRLELIGLLP